MGMFNLFTPNPATPAATVAQPTAAPQAAPGTQHNPAQNLQTKNDATTAGNGVVPAAVTTETAKPSGLDQFADLFQTVAKTDAAQGQPLFNVTAEQVQAAALKRNFVTPPNEAQIAAITAGGPEAVKAMMELMNTTAQNVFAQSAIGATKLIEHGIENTSFVRPDEVQKFITDYGVTTSLREVNPLANNPAAQPIIDMLRERFTLKNPSATPKEITEQVNSYMTHLANAIKAPEEQSKQQQQQAATMDWSKFLG